MGVPTKQHDSDSGNFLQLQSAVNLTNRIHHPGVCIGYAHSYTPPVPDNTENTFCLNLPGLIQASYVHNSYLDSLASVISPAGHFRPGTHIFPILNVNNQPFKGFKEMG